MFVEGPQSESLALPHFRLTNMLSIIIASLFAAAAMANPIAVASRADSDCTTILSGYLAGNASGRCSLFL